MEAEEPQSQIDQITDIYIPATPIDGGPANTPGSGVYCFAGTPDVIWVRDTPLEPWMARLAADVWQQDAQSIDSDYTVLFDGRRYRAHRKMTESGPEVNLRHIPLQCPTLSDLKFPPMWAGIFASKSLLAGGLVIFAAEAGQGKTTAASAMVRSRSEKFGGYGQTVENPAELPLEGAYGKGVVRQTSVNWDAPFERDRGWAGAMRGALRSFPTTRGNMLFVGEVRDAETAAELIQAAVNGLLVITTLHALSPQAAIYRLISLADRKLDGQAGELLASALRLVVHQQLSLASDVTGWKRGVITGRLLFSDGEGHPVANAIRSRNFNSLAQPMSMQDNILRMSAQVSKSPDEVLGLMGTGGKGIG